MTVDTYNTDYCCCRVNIKRTAFWIGIVSAILEGLIVVAVLIHILNQQHQGANLAFDLIVLALLILDFIVSGLIPIGVKRRNPALLLPYLIIQGVFIALIAAIFLFVSACLIISFGQHIVQGLSADSNSSAAAAALSTNSISSSSAASLVIIIGSFSGTLGVGNYGTSVRRVHGIQHTSLCPDPSGLPCHALRRQ